MLSVFTYQVLRLLRERVLLVWTLGFPIILSLIFMAMFSNLDDDYKADAVALGVVQDDAYRAAPGLDETISSISADGSDLHLIDTTSYATEAEAVSAAQRGETSGYIDVEDGTPVLHVSQEWNTASGSQANTILVLRAVMDSYVQTGAEHAALASAGAPAEQVGRPDAGRVFTHQTQVTPSLIKSETRYYFSLLAFACGMGMTVSTLAVQGIMATSARPSRLGARLSLASLPRWRVLAGTLAASWVCILGCLVIAFAFIRLVIGVDFGPHTLLALVAIGVSSLMSCAAGAALGTVRAEIGAGTVSGISCLLSLFTGLYGSPAQNLAAAVEFNAPVLAQANPLWQSAHCFYGLLYYDSLAPFARSCAVLAGMTCLFLSIAMVRMRRMSHEHL